MINENVKKKTIEIQQLKKQKNIIEENKINKKDNTNKKRRSSKLEGEGATAYFENPQKLYLMSKYQNSVKYKNFLHIESVFKNNFKCYK